MADFTTTRKVEWGDCDPAGIIYYPRYYHFMDGAFQDFAASRGFSQRSLREEHGLLGTPLVDTGCRFLSPLTYGDEATVAVTVEHVGGSSLRLSYLFSIGDRRTAEGFEARVFARKAPGGIEKAAIPENVRLRLK
ncbi:MAG: acyl-CoA thioesterase [Pseudomonadota bacterium]